VRFGVAVQPGQVGANERGVTVREAPPGSWAPGTQRSRQKLRDISGASRRSVSSSSPSRRTAAHLSREPLGASSLVETLPRKEPSGRGTGSGTSRSVWRPSSESHASCDARTSGERSSADVRLSPASTASAGAPPPSGGGGL
jgi:hypothetical protein